MSVQVTEPRHNGRQGIAHGLSSLSHLDLHPVMVQKMTPESQLWLWIGSTTQWVRVKCRTSSRAGAALESEPRGSHIYRMRSIEYVGE